MWKLMRGKRGSNGEESVEVKVEQESGHLAKAKRSVTKLGRFAESRGNSWRA
jgi:hypothetical protein